MSIFFNQERIWQKGKTKQKMKLAQKMIANRQYKELLSHYNKAKKGDWRSVELSRDDVWSIIRNIDDIKVKADFIAAGAFVARADPFNAHSPETQERYYKQEHEFSDFVMEQIPDEKLWAKICVNLPKKYSSYYNTYEVVADANTLARDLFEHIQSEELIQNIQKHNQFRTWKKRTPEKPKKEQPKTQEDWIKIAMDGNDIYTRMNAAAQITDISLIPDTQKERCANGRHLWIDNGSIRQKFQYGTSVDKRKCIYCGEEFYDINYGD